MKKIFVTIPLISLFLFASCEIVSSYSNSNENRTGKENISIYAINDFHGAINYSPADDEPGLARVATYLKDKKSADPEHTIVLSSGDMWQGTFESYHNKGKVITEAMNNIGFDSMTIGNHEFDWGAEDIIYNEQFANFPILGANIMEYPNTNVKSSIGESYVVLEKGKMKIGIIGVIGQDQITSINSRYMTDLYFADPTPIVKELSTKLRKEEKVDIVVLSIHAGQGSVDSSLAAKGKYVDAIFCAHTHYAEKQLVNGVPYIQGGSKGQHVSEINLSFDYDKNKVEFLSYTNWSTATIKKQIPDSEVEAIVDSYGSLSSVAGNAVVGTASSNLTLNNYLPNISNYVAAKHAKKEGYNINLVMTNIARETISYGEIKYRDMFRGLPFDNRIYIAKAKGRDIKFEAEYNYVYRENETLRVNSYDDNEYYLIAVIDYLLFHQNTNKEYNYFSNFNPDTDIVGYLKNDDGKPYYPRDMVADHIMSLNNKTINPSNYSGDRYRA